MSKVKLSELETLIIKLQKLKLDTSLMDSQRSFAASLLTHYLKYKTLTGKQKYAALNLVKRAKPRGKHKPRVASKSYYLYAMTAGDKVKLGFSSEVKRRKSQIQTGNHDKVELVWSLKCGITKTQARNNEKKLHRVCNDYRVKGEWFTSDCLPMVKAFKVK